MSTEKTDLSPVEAKGRGPVDVPARWAGVAFLGTLGGLVALMVLGIGFVHSALLIVVLVCFGTASGAALVRLLFPHAGLLYLLVLGTVIGLGLWAVGGLLSSVSGIYLARWAPLVLASALWILPRRAHQKSIHEAETRASLPFWGVAGAALASIALLPSLKTTLASQPVDWTGWYRFYADVPFHIALTSEVAARPPDVFPFVPDATLSYTWLFHSAMGVWSSVSSVPAAEIVLRAWPILFVGLLPILLSIVAWEVTRNRLVSAISPLVYVLVHGLVVVESGALTQHPLLSVSPTRDFAHLFSLIAVLSMVHLFQRRSTSESNGRWWLVILVFSSFVAAGAKGSEFPILLGGILSAGLALILTRRVRRTDFISLAWFLVAGIGATLLVMPEPSNAFISFGPLTFLDSETPNRALTSTVILALLAAIVVGHLVVNGTRSRGDWIAAGVLGGISAAGILGLGLFAHPGASQNYFWQGAQPVFAIAMAWAFALLWREHGAWLGAAVLLVLLAANVSWALTNQVWLVACAVAGVAAVAAIVLHLMDLSEVDAKPRRWLRIATTAVLASVLVGTAQIVSVPPGVAGGAASTQASSGAIHESQLAAFRYIRTNSSPDEVIVTNKHCFAGGLATDDCLPRWFALAAWAERRVLVEGWSYTQLSESPESVREQLELSTDFVDSPTAAKRETLLEMNVSLVYIDKRNHYSRDLGDVGTLVYESDWANVYSLTGSRSEGL